ncbi:hypothetical protein B0H14DRAFT_2578905 [Mycena olivaceomarginata]|nr:hypothetical protein B0H14DRAFT_2578905 [Mycena olivaceomarginata]
MGIQVLDGAITALTVAKTSITGLGVPGVEPAINSVLQIATMVSTMKDNREGLIKLVEHLEALTAAIKTPAPSGELQNRLILLSSKFSALIADCQSIAGKSRFKRFLNGAKYQDKISTIKNSVASCVIEFTVRA